MSEPKRPVVVVGAGIIGLSIAWRAAQRGFRVTVFDKGRLGGEASWAGAGMLAPGGEAEEACEFTSLLLESRRMYPAFVRELGGGIDYQECGALDVAYSAEELAALETRAARQQAAGISSHVVTSEEVREKWPLVSRDGLAGARFYPEDAIVNPRDVVARLAERCRELEVDLVEQQQIESVRAGDEITVIAAGAWSGSIRVESAPPLPSSEPVKGHLIGYREPVGTCPTIVRHGPAYFLQRANGLLIAGASVEHAGFDRSISRKIQRDLQTTAERVFPHLASRDPDEVWTGFRPGPESLRLGSWHAPDLLLAYGHFRNGILLAPVTAERIADLIAVTRTRSRGGTA